MPAALTVEDLQLVARTKVFFGHQSVGMNILDAAPEVFARPGVAAPRIVEGRTPPSGEGGFIEHNFIGQNEHPDLKLKDFEAALRNGRGDHVDIAMMKFCYIDITSDTDIDAMWASYRDTISALEESYPNVKFVKTTVPLTTESNWKSWLKAWLGRGDRFGQSENVARERLNELIRREYADDDLFDIALVESTAPDGSRTGGTYHGKRYFTLYHGYASDLGHLNDQGAQRAASAWVAALARAAAK